MLRVQNLWPCSNRGFARGSDQGVNEERAAEDLQFRGYLRAPRVTARRSRRASASRSHSARISSFSLPGIRAA